jgi:uncharacterized protein
VLDDDMKRVVNEQRLGFVASVCPDGTPNLSPKGTTAVWDDQHLIFAHLHSPQTVANIEAGNTVVAINVVDPIVRKGYRFKGVATVLSDGSLHDEIVQFYRKRGSANPFRHIVLMKVEHAAALVSPVYDLGRTEEEVSAQWERRRDDLRRRRAEASTE